MVRSNFRGRHMKYFEGILGMYEPHYELLLFLFYFSETALLLYCHCKVNVKSKQTDYVKWFIFVNQYLMLLEYEWQSACWMERGYIVRKKNQLFFLFLFSLFLLSRG